jgi:hypothetical protein
LKNEKTTLSAVGWSGTFLVAWLPCHTVTPDAVRSREASAPMTRSARRPERALTTAETQRRPFLLRSMSQAIVSTFPLGQTVDLGDYPACRLRPDRPAGLLAWRLCLKGNADDANARQQMMGLHGQTGASESRPKAGFKALSSFLPASVSLRTSSA